MRKKDTTLMMIPMMEMMGMSNTAQQEAMIKVLNEQLELVTLDLKAVPTMMRQQKPKKKTLQGNWMKRTTKELCSPRHNV